MVIFVLLIVDGGLTARDSCTAKVHVWLVTERVLESTFVVVLSLYVPVDLVDVLVVSGVVFSGYLKSMRYRFPYPLSISLPNSYRPAGERPRSHLEFWPGLYQYDSERSEFACGVAARYDAQGRAERSFRTARTEQF